MSNNLKPCPFCGDKGRPRRRSEAGVKCHTCGAWGPTRDETNAEGWNARAADARLAALEAENAAARGVIAQANNSLYGSCGFFLSVNGGDADMSHLSRPIEELKDRARRAYALEAENARLRVALDTIINHPPTDHDFTSEECLSMCVDFASEALFGEAAQ